MKETPHRTIAAVHLLPSNTRGERLGLFTQLPANTPLSVCGNGAIENTVKVEVKGDFYLVFRRDIEAARTKSGRESKR